MVSKILVVEDNKALQLLVQKQLKRNNFDVVVADSGSTALALLLSDEGNEISVIFLDIMMPMMNGVQFLEKAQSICEERKIKICMLTALADKEKIVECLNLGAHDYIIKAAEEELLVNKAKFLLGEQPEFQFSKIDCDFSGSFFLETEEISVQFSEIHEDHVVFKFEGELDEGRVIELRQGDLIEMFPETPILFLRIFNSKKEGKVSQCKANFIGLNETQIKSLRSKTMKGGALAKGKTAA